MAKQQQQLSTTVGLSLGFLGIVGLVVSLVSLVPVNVYNILLIVKAGVDLLQLCNYDLSPDAFLLAVFYAGSIVSSLITMTLVLVTCLRHSNKAFWLQAQQQHERDVESSSPTSSSSAAQDPTASAAVKARSVWFNRVGCFLFVGQMGWALFGTHLLFFMDINPAALRKSTLISVCILWLNYVIITLFSFILFCASFFIVLGSARKHRRRRHHHSARTAPPASSIASSSSGEEMQYQRGEETTPLLKATTTPLT